MPLTDEEVRRLHSRASAIRKRIIQVAYSAGGGHVGGSLSQTDVVTALYFKYLNVDPANPEKPDRDRFILSKGHAGLGQPLLVQFNNVAHLEAPERHFAQTHL